MKNHFKMRSSIFFMANLLVLMFGICHCEESMLSVVTNMNKVNGLNIGSIVTLGQKAYDAVTILIDAWNSFGTTGYVPPDTSPSAMLYYSLAETIDTWNEQFAELRQVIIDRNQYMEDLVHELGSKARIDDALREFNEDLLAVQKTYNRFMKTMKDHSDNNTNVAPLGKFTFKYLSTGDVDTKMIEIYDYIIPTLNTQDNFLMSLVTYFETLSRADRLCGLNHSPVDYLQSLFTSILMTELQGYMLLVAGTTFLYSNQNHPDIQYPYSLPPSEKIKFWNIRIEKRMKAYGTAFIEAMSNSKSEFIMCPSQSFDRYNDYLELEGSIQNVIQPFTKLTAWNASFQYYMDDEFIRNCRGDFEFLDLVKLVTNVCYKPYGSKRYQFLILDNKRSLQQCDTDDMYFNFKKEAANRGKCYENSVNSRSTHVVNLLPVEADVGYNKVLTGIRFIVVQGVLHVQIQQGKLGSNFRVVEVDWKPIENIAGRVRASRLKIDYEGLPTGLEENKDYAILSKDLRQFQLGDAIAEHGYVITGVKLSLSKKKRLQLVVLARKFDEKTGKLNLNSAKVMITPDEIDYKLQLNDTTPLYYNPQDEFQYVNDAYIEFDSSDWDYDNGQTTVPFFEARNIVTSPPTPLLGIGTFIRFSEDNSGVISVKCHSLNYTAYIDKSLQMLDDFFYFYQHSVYY